MPRPVRREARELVGQRPVEVASRQHEIHDDPARSLRLGSHVRGKRSGQCREGGREVRPRLGQEAESAGGRMPASFRQERGAGLERSRNVEVGRRPDRAANLVADERRCRDRTSEAVREAAGNEADEPGRPGVVADEQRARAALRGDEQAGRIDGLLRQLPATLVDRLELDGQLLGTRSDLPRASG